MVERQVLPNHIQEFVDNNPDAEKFLELFQATKKDIDLKTELNVKELVIVNKIRIMSEFLISKKLSPIYSDYINSHMRLRVSTDRKSRGEFVDIHKKDRFEQNLKKFGDFKNLTDSKS